MALANVPRWGNLLYRRATKGTHIDMTKPQGTEMAKLWLRLCIKNANSKNYHAHIINLLRNKIILQIFSANRFDRRYACLTVCDWIQRTFCFALPIEYIIAPIKSFDWLLKARSTNVSSVNGLRYFVS